MPREQPETPTMAELELDREEWRRRKGWKPIEQDRPEVSWTVTWTIEVDATDAIGAAIVAQDYMGSPESIAHVYQVYPGDGHKDRLPRHYTEVDLDASEYREVDVPEGEP